MAGNNVVTKEIQKLRDEEEKLIEDYYNSLNRQPKKSHKLAKNHLSIKKRSPQRSGNYNSQHRGDSRQATYGEDYDDSRPYNQGGQNQPSQGMNQMSEIERVDLIAKLERLKKDLMSKIQSLPVCNRSPAVEIKEKELYRDLDEVTAQANLLSNRNVFVA